MPLTTTGALDWNLVRTFVTVAEQGSLTAGARELGLAHPTVARHVQSLEANLGMSLFDRRATGLALNDAGQRLLVSARGMLESARAFELATSAVRSTTSGRLRITASELIADVFPQMLAPLRTPGGQGLINVELLIGSDLLNLLQGEADIAIRHVEPRQKELICRRLSGLPLCLYASRGYLAEHGSPTLKNMHSHSFIDGIRAPIVYREARRMGFNIAREQFVFRSDSFASRINGAVAGWGIAVVPVHVAQQRRELERVLTDVPLDEIEMWLVGRQDVRTTPYLRDAFAIAGDSLNAFASALSAAQGTGATRTRPKRTVSA